MDAEPAEAKPAIETGSPATTAPETLTAAAAESRFRDQAQAAMKRMGTAGGAAAVTHPKFAATFDETIETGASALRALAANGVSLEALTAFFKCVAK
jgi:hypothetical protein